MTLSDKPRTAVRRDVAQETQTESRPILEPPIAAVMPRVVRDNIEDGGVSGEPYTPHDDESKAV